jgi:hypothetical protein
LATAPCLKKSDDGHRGTITWKYRGPRIMMRVATIASLRKSQVGMRDRCISSGSAASSCARRFRLAPPFSISGHKNSSWNASRSAASRVATSGQLIAATECREERAGRRNRQLHASKRKAGFWDRLSAGFEAGRAWPTGPICAAPPSLTLCSPPRRYAHFPAFLHDCPGRRQHGRDPCGKLRRI